MKSLFLFGLLLFTSILPKENVQNLETYSCKKAYEQQIKSLNDEFDDAIEGVWYAGGDLRVMLLLDEIRDEWIKDLEAFKKSCPD